MEVILDKDILGLSCVENHVLSFIKPRCERFGLIYFDCFVSSHDVFEACKDNSFDYYNGIDRIQDVLKLNNLLDIEMYKADFIAFLNHLHKEQNMNTQVLMQVDSATAQQKFFARGLRNDHYISVQYGEGDYIITNDIPHKRLNVFAKELEDLFVGNYLIIKYKECYPRREFDFINDSKKTNLCDLKYTIEPDVVASDGFINTFINMLVIIRVLRQRLSVFLNSIGTNVDIHGFIANYTKLMTQAEYMRIRKICDMESYQMMLNNFNQLENELFEVISNVYGG